MRPNTVTKDQSMRQCHYDHYDIQVMVVNSESDFGHRIEPTIISDHEITSDCMICLFDFI